MSKHPDLQDSHPRSTDPRYVLSHLAGLMASIESDPGRTLSLLLQSALNLVQGKFVLYSHFDFERSLSVTLQGCRLPLDFPESSRLPGSICFEELVVSGKPCVVFGDLDQTRYAATDPDVRRHRIKACIGVPVRLSGRTVGSLAVMDDHVRVFDDLHCRMLELMAHLIAFVTGRQQRDRLLHRRQISDRLLSAISAKAIATRDDSFLDYCLCLIGDALSLDGVCLLWYDPDQRTFSQHDLRWVDGAITRSSQTRDAHLLALKGFHKVVRKKKPFYCNDVAQLPDGKTRSLLRQNDITAFLLMPIWNQRQVYGLCAISMKNGSRIWDEESLDALMAIMDIISQWKEARSISKELDESQSLIFQLFQLSPTSIYQIDFNSGRFVKVNDQMCRSTGYREEELLAMKPGELLTPESRRVFEQRLADIAAGRPVSSNVEFQIQTKDGQLEWGHFHIRHLSEGDRIWGANVVVHILTEQKRAYEELAEYRRRLEALVEERTRELQQSNEKLREEISRRTETARELRLKSERLEELNTAMRVLLDKRNEDRLRSEENIRVNLVQLIEPYLDRLDQSGLSSPQQQLLDVIRTNLNDVVGSPMPELSAKYYIFSPGELQVANLIRKGRTTKDMARLLNISPRTVESFRNSIRKKLGLKNKKINLKTYLSSKE